MTYRERNGYIDDGSPAKGGHRSRYCPKCGSRNYLETVSREHCNACGYDVDYWSPTQDDSDE